MNKIQKIDYINAVVERFRDARNHGNGGNWFYPTSNVIAYNVKIYGGCSIDSLRSKMSKRQSEHYSDSELYDVISQIEVDNAQMFRDDICNEYAVVDAYYAGRSGGWLEVKYSVDFDSVDNSTVMSDITTFYKQAKELEQLESEIHEHIKNCVQAHEIYVDSDEYIVDIFETSILSDDDIADIYKDKITSYANRLI